MQKRNLGVHRMTGDELSWLILSEDTVEFNSAEQFHAWLFVLNFSTLKHYLTSTTKRVHDKMYVMHQLPFMITMSPGGVDFENNFVLSMNLKKHEEGPIEIIGFSLPYSSPETRMVVKALKEKTV